MTQHDKAIELIEYIKFANEKTLNEATTRSRIIDTVIYDILAWPKNKVIHEESINEGYIDYTLKNDSNDNNIIIEAKKINTQSTMSFAHHKGKLQHKHRNSHLTQMNYP